MPFWEFSQSFTNIPGLPAQAGHICDLAVAGYAARGDSGDNLPDFLVFGGFGHDDSAVSLRGAKASRRSPFRIM